jgi:PAS domain S-box-containing protein
MLSGSTSGALVSGEDSRLFRRILDTTAEAMVLVDREGEILLVDQPAGTLLGYRQEEMVGQKIEILLPDRFRANHPHLRTAFSAHPQKRAMSSRNELYGLRKDGSEFPIAVSLSPIETEYGLLISSTILDVSARKLAEQTTESGWQDKERYKNEFLSHVSHGLRSPLTVIKQFTTIILSGLAGDLYQGSRRRKQGSCVAA